MDNRTTQTAGYIAAFQTGNSTKALIDVAGTISSNTAQVGPGAQPTGRTVVYNGDMRRGFYKVTLARTYFTTNTSVHDIDICTIPAKGKVVSIICDVTQAFAGTGLAVISLRAGTSSNGQQYILDFDALAGLSTKGLADADLGASITRAAAIQGGHTPSWSGTTAIYGTLNGDAALGTGTATNLTAGSVTFYVTVDLP